MFLLIINKYVIHEKVIEAIETFANSNAYLLGSATFPISPCNFSSKRPTVKITRNYDMAFKNCLPSSLLSGAAVFVLVSHCLCSAQQAAPRPTLSAYGDSDSKIPAL